MGWGLGTLGGAWRPGHDKDGTEEVTFTWRGEGGNVLTPLCKPRVQSTPVFTMPALKVTIYILIDINEHFVSLHIFKTQKYAWRWKWSIRRSILGSVIMYMSSIKISQTTIDHITRTLWSPGDVIYRGLEYFYKCL